MFLPDLEFVDAWGRTLAIGEEIFDHYDLAALTARQLERKFGKDWRVQRFRDNGGDRPRLLYTVQFRTAKGEYSTLLNNGQLREQWTAGPSAAALAELYYSGRWEEMSWREVIEYCRAYCMEQAEQAEKAEKVEKSEKAEETPSNVQE